MNFYIENILADTVSPQVRPSVPPRDLSANTCCFNSLTDKITKSQLKMPTTRALQLDDNRSPSKHCVEVRTLTDSLMNFSSEEDTDARSVSPTLRTLWLEESESTQVQAVEIGTMTDPIVQEHSLKLLRLLERDWRGNEQLSQQCRRLQTENRRLSEANAEMRRTKIKLRHLACRIQVQEQTTGVRNTTQASDRVRICTYPGEQNSLITLSQVINNQFKTSYSLGADEGSKMILHPGHSAYQSYGQWDKKGEVL